jgi:endonuclease YncB( thermonuclease family)
MKITLVALVLSLASLAPALSRESGGDRLQGVAWVIDGDTIEIHGTRIRLNGIDAPESAQTCDDAQGRPWRCGQRASLALADRIGRGTVSCDPTGIDRYGRTIADCRLDGESLNGWMVRMGWAVAYRHYALDHVGDEDRARAAQRGLWQGRFDMPWDWRAAQRQDSGPASPDLGWLMLLAGQGNSCNPRKTCTAIGSCEEAHWYLQNCSWGSKLDRDGDGVPCESMC